MRRLTLPTLATALLFSSLSAQVQPVKLKVQVVLIDKDLNQKPVPKLVLSLRRLSETGGGEQILIKTGLDGRSEVEMPPGRYQLSSPQPVEFQGKRYTWELELVLSKAEETAELTNDNAKVSEATPEQPSRKTDELTVQFKRLQNSVVTVWSQIGHGTGFIVDTKGLVLTNQHVVGPSEIIAVQFDQKRKVRATLLVADPSKDVAVLWANLAALPDALIAPIARTDTKEPTVVEGERVFTIGSPLSQRKILTTGIASKIEARAIISDININPGNSGGPLFNSLGYVVGLTTFGEQGRPGPGISGIVRIEEAFPLLGQARVRMASTPIPDPTLLPVEPNDTFPIDAIKEAVQVNKFDTHPYVFGAGDYDVAVVTPALKYYFELKSQVEAAKEKEKRTKKKPEAVKDTFRPLDNLRNWEEYAGQYKPVLLIQASPKLRETFWSAFGRGLAASGGHYGGAAKMRFKTDFYQMRLLCNGKEIQPIQPVKIATVIDVKNAFVNATDATYEGSYSYPADAIAPSCLEVILELYSEKDPNKATRKTLDKKTVDRVWLDFEPYRRITAKGPRADQKP
jgi:hypothetical protein